MKEHNEVRVVSSTKLETYNLGQTRNISTHSTLVNENILYKYLDFP